MHLFILASLYSIASGQSAYNVSQVHLSLFSNATSLVVQWSVDALPTTVYVKFAKMETSTLSYSYSKALCRSFHTSEVDPSSRLLHTCIALLQDLDYNSYYYYCMGSDSLGWSKLYTLRSNRNSTEARFIVYADLGIGVQVVETMASLYKIIQLYEFDGVIHAGDIAYDLDYNNGQVGDEFFTNIEPIASRMPYMVSQGNHEIGNTIYHYRKRFTMPGGNDNMWYTFNYGKAHFLAYTTEPAFYQSATGNYLMAKQLEFIKNDLQKLNRTEYPWLIIYNHRPYYCTPSYNNSLYFKEDPIQLGVQHDVEFTTCQTAATMLRDMHEDMWYNNKVDVVITAHVHYYERFGPMYKNENKGCNVTTNNYCQGAKAPIYLVVGAAGNRESYAYSSTNPTGLFQTTRISFGEIHVSNETYLNWKQYDSYTFEVIDSLDLFK